MAKTLATLVKVHRHQVEDQQRALAQLIAARDQTIAARAALDVEMAAERVAAAKDLEGLQALPAYTKAAMARAAQMEARITEFEGIIEAGRAELQRRFETLKSFELAQQAEQERARVTAGKLEQQALDEVAATMDRRKDK